MIYQVTKKECEKNIHGVCEGCGGQLSAIETVDNSGLAAFWQGCEKCGCFRSGVEPIYFKIARRLVEERRILPYSHLDEYYYKGTPEQLAYFYDCQTAGLSHTIKYIDKLLKETI